MGETFTVLGALAELPPAPVESFLVQTADLTRASEVAGIERPTEVDQDAVRRWVNPLTGAPGVDDPAPVFVPLPSFSTPGPPVQEFHDLAGWSLIDVASYVEFGTEPYVFTVVAGEYADDTLHHLPEVSEGVRTVGEGEDLDVDLTQRSAVSRLGQPVRMTLADGKLALGARTPMVQGWLTGSGPSLAEDVELSALAEALDARGVVSAMLVVGSAGSFAHLPLAFGDAEEPEVDFLPDHPFSATAVGWTVEDDRPRMIVAYHYASPELADEAVEDLRTMLTEGSSLVEGWALSAVVELVDVTSEGTVAVASLNAVQERAPHILPNMLIRRDVPFVHQ